MEAWKGETNMLPKMWTVIFMYHVCGNKIIVFVIVMVVVTQLIDKYMRQ